MGTPTIKNNKTIEYRGYYGDDWFKIIYSRRSNLYLKDYLKDFDLDEYWIYKATNKQREVSIDKFLRFEYSGYMLFRKDKYDKEHIDKWLEWIFGLKIIFGLQYLSKPFPPFNPSKIIIKL